MVSAVPPANRASKRDVRFRCVEHAPYGTAAVPVPREVPLPINSREAGGAISKGSDNALSCPADDCSFPPRKRPFLERYSDLRDRVYVVAPLRSIERDMANSCVPRVERQHRAPTYIRQAVAIPIRLLVRPENDSFRRICVAA